MHGAGPAQSNAATELGPGQADDVAQDPQEGHVVRNIELMVLAIDSERRH